MSAASDNVKLGLDTPAILFSYQAESNLKVDKDFLLTFTELKKRADTGDTSGQLLVALAYNFGMYGATINQNEYLRYLQLAAQKEDKSPANLTALGFCYQWAYGAVKIKNLDKAKEYFLQAANQGYVPAAMEYTEMLFRESFSSVQSSSGHSIEQRDEVKLKEIVRLMTPLAEMGYQRAQCRLGVFYNWGYGVYKDETQARKLFEMAADAGDAAARCDLAIFYDGGTGGLPRNLPKAKELYESSSNQGYERGQKNLEIFKHNHGCCTIL